MAAVSAKFFDPSNSDNQKQREELARLAQDDMYSWLRDQDGVLIGSCFAVSNYMAVIQLTA